jgi:phage shock protein E
MIRNAFIAALVTLTIPLLAFAEDLTHTKDPLSTVKDNVEAGKAVIVDVREDREWKAGHVKGAIHLPKSKLESNLAELVKKLDKDKVIYTHCGAGRRALACGELLKKEGFDVRPLKSGYEQLIEAGFESEEK